MMGVGKSRKPAQSPGTPGAETPDNTEEESKMSISDTISQAAASNPIVGEAVAAASTKSAILAGLQSGDTTTGSLLGAIYSQSDEVNSLLSKLQPNLGQNINTTA